ncbi:hydantoinase A [Bordetella trematum]|nr:hydantoinase A [Bordetella trematum]
MMGQDIRLGADIGGTFTDVALDVRGTLYSTKVLTNYAAPEQGILDAIAIVAGNAGIALADIDLIIHGTTLATNALIERRGARTALITTEGFRDVIEMRTENRFEQYDLNITLPPPLIPREDRYSVAGRISARAKSCSRWTRRRWKTSPARSSALATKPLPWASSTHT